MINQRNGRIPSPSFNFSNPYQGFKRIAELLYSLIFGGDFLGFEQIEVDDTVTVALNVPESAKLAIIACEADETTVNTDFVVHFRQDGDVTAPTSEVGMALGNAGSVEITGNDSLKSIRFIGREVGRTHKLKVEYYA